MEVEQFVKELELKHRRFLDSIVDDLPIGYLQSSIRLEVEGILFVLQDIDGDKNMGDYIPYYEEVLEKINQL